nr:MAG TPA: hypothetical protein [Caudoviricetes sp.]DAO71820.1 MAG TPA: hypothetical protein [Caudoviricetes sp.]
MVVHILSTEFANTTGYNKIQLDTIYVDQSL